ncbi:MAG: twitching motility protein PilT [Acidimicrobiaceae bacterium]|nr:twitching motility protein PilT [Acidimicrobiaceae bacterium]
MNGVTYDTGALIAADRNDRRMWALHAGFLALEVSPTVPTPVLAEAWRREPRQARLDRFLALCTTEPLTEEQAKAIGALAARAGHDEIVDVTVVDGAIRRHDAVVTSNPTHIRKIADATRTRLTI